MKYVFIAYNCYPFPLAVHLMGEGQEVIIAVATAKSQLCLPGSGKENETPEERRGRFDTYDGLIGTITLSELFKLLKAVPAEKRGEYFFFFDYSDMYVLAERILDMGFKNGLFPTELYYRFEKERELSKKFVKQYYPDVKVADSFNFTSVQDGIKHINESEDIWVLKSNGNIGKTVVPKAKDLKVAKKLLIDTLQKYKKDYEKGGFLLEKKIQNCLEITPIIVFYNGEPVYSLVEIENKEFGAGNIGAQKGGNQALSIRTELDAEINKIAFPDVIYKLAKNHPGMSIYDAGLLYDGKDFYFTEFCAMRFGWDGIFSEIVMRDDGEPFVNKYFEDVRSGKNPLKNKYGVAVRLFNYEGNTEETGTPKEDIPIMFYKTIKNNLFLYMVRMLEDQLVSVGGYDLLGAITGADNDLETAVKKTYDRIEKFNCEKLYYRPCFDFLSKDYPTSILNRLSALEKFI